MSRLAASRAKQPPPTRTVGVLQRQCACGAHTGGGACTACSGKPPSVQALARGGVAGAAGALPYLDRIQESFGPGHDLTGVRAHSGGEAVDAAARMGAQAYAFGDRVAFAAPPSLHTAAHEAAHVVQQRAGVRPAGGVGRAGDSHEQHADAVARRVVQRQSSRDLLAPYATASPASGEGPAIQMTPQNTFYGKMVDKITEKVDPKKPEKQPGVTMPEKTPLTGRGVRRVISFEPGIAADATQIAMVQGVKRTFSDSPTYNHPVQRDRMVGIDEPGGAYRIDRDSRQNNPIFEAPSLESDQELTDTPMANTFGRGDYPENATYQIGFRYLDPATNTLKKRDAFLDDNAVWDTPGPAAMEFETAAVAIGGKQAGLYYGSVKWGWEIDARGELKILDFLKVSDGTPSPNLTAAAAKWNASTASGTVVTRRSHVQVYLYIRERMVAAHLKGTRDLFQLKTGTTVEIVGDPVAMGADTYRNVIVQDGEFEGGKGFVKVSDLLDEGDGEPTRDLPPPIAESKPQPVHLSQGGVTAVFGQDPDSLLRLDTVSVIAFGDNEVDSLAMLTDLSDAATDRPAGPQRMRLRMYSYDLDAPSNDTVARRLRKAAKPHVEVYIETEKVREFHGYQQGFNYKNEINRIVAGAPSHDTLSSIKAGTAIGGAIGGAIGVAVGTVIGGVGGALLGSLLGSALGSAIGLGIGYIAGNDVGDRPPSPDDLKQIESFILGSVPDDLDHSLSIKIVNFWFHHPEKVEAIKKGALDYEQRQVLINNLIKGFTGDAEERAILKIIENSTDTDLLRIFSPRDENAPKLLTLEDEFDGSEKVHLQKLLDRLRDRFPLDVPLQKTQGLLIDDPFVQTVLRSAFQQTHEQEPDTEPKARECAGVFIAPKKGGKIEHRGTCVTGTSVATGEIARFARRVFGRGYEVVGSYHTHPRTLPQRRDDKPQPDYPPHGREAPSSGDFASFLKDPGRGREHYVVGPFVTYLILREGAQMRMLGNTADLLNVDRIKPQPGQKSTLELG